MFYNALVKFRDEQLENYEGQPLEYSASDYHHISRQPWARRRGSRRQGSIRRRSHFSVLKDKAQRNSLVQDPVSSGALGNHDPLRSSLNTSPKHQHAQSTKQQEVLETARRPSTAGTVKSTGKHANTNPGEQVEPPENSPYVVVQNKKKVNSVKSVKSVKSFQSKASRSKSRRALNPNTTTRSASYKRNVSFRHARTRSQGSTASGKINHTKNPVPELPVRKSSLRHAAGIVDMERSPSLPDPPATVRRSGVEMGNGILVKKARDADVVWKDEARKVSHELSQICEEAFNASSSTVRASSICESADTPATSVTMISPENSHHLLTSNKIYGWPLPDRSNGAAGSSIAELVETRRKLIEHSTTDGSDRVPDYLSGVITHLDRLIEQDKLKKASTSEGLDRTAQPLPELAAGPSNDAGYLPAINEELLTALDNTCDHMSKQNKKCPSKSLAGSYTSRPSHEGKPSIRMVSHPSLGSIEEVKPLNVRKRTQPVPPADNFESIMERQRLYATHDYLSTRIIPSGSRQLHPPCELDTIEEVPRTPTRTDTKGSERKWAWFKNKSSVLGEDSPRPSETVQPAFPKVPLADVHEFDPSRDFYHLNQKTPFDKPKGNFFTRLMKRKPKNNTPHIRPSGKLQHKFWIFLLT